ILTSLTGGGFGTGKITFPSGTSDGTLSLKGATTVPNSIIIPVNTFGKVNSSDSTATISGIISGAGALQKFGSSTLVLSGVNTYTGGTVVSGGTLQIGANFLLGGVQVDAGAILDLNGLSSTTEILKGAGSITLGAGTLTEGFNSAVSSTFAGVI